ncbi:MAG TPA: flavin reductase family protein [Streptosporangiaceae bacterium]|nr:flavin reductase family protein [Streptosporangiaceae bacterium]
MTTVTRPALPEVTSSGLRQFMRNWPGGAAIVTACRDGHPAGCTVTAFFSVSLNPPLVLISLSRQSRTLSAIAEHGAFGVNVLSWRHRGLAGRFAEPHTDRFADVPYRLQDSVPILEDAMAALVCELEQLFPAADHTLVLGRPQWYVCDDSQDPVVLFGGTHQRIAGYGIPADGRGECAS